MRFVSDVRLGRPGFGLLREDGVVDLTHRFGPAIRTLMSSIAADFLSEGAASSTLPRPIRLPT